MRGTSFWKRFVRGWRRIHVVDKSLMLFMLMLLLWSGHHLLSSKPTSPAVEAVGVVVRTASASIFGYFISANFIRRERSDQQDTPDTNAYAGRSASPPATSAGAGAPTSAAGAPASRRIGFAVPDEPPPPPSATPAPLPDDNEVCGRLQVLIVSAIGLFSLVILFLTSQVSLPESSALASISQLRDFISGCVGFLIGSPTNAPSGRT